jgi:hypothetical protein
VNRGIMAQSRHHHSFNTTVASMSMISKRTTLVAALFAMVFFSVSSRAQTRATSREDSLATGGAKPSSTFIGGYGSAVYQNDRNAGASRATLERVVLFVGHAFSSGISLFTEMEIEDAKVEGGEEGGELAFEQAYIKFDVARNHSIVAGLFIPRLGIINEQHLPTSFHGNERPHTERLVIPSTWRELGIGYYGALDAVDMRYSLALTTGLDARGFGNGRGIRGGRFEGSNATADNLALSGSVQLRAGDFQIQCSGYAGGASGLTAKQADSLQLRSGMFGTPVLLGEADVQYANGGFAATALAAFINIPDADRINRAYANNTPESLFGAYAEVSYDLLHVFDDAAAAQLCLFLRYETMDLNTTIASNGIQDDALKQQHLVAGVSFLPVPNVVVKADVRSTRTGQANPALRIDPDAIADPYQRSNVVVNLGIGYSF